jgi:dihydrofolate reductase
MIKIIVARSSNGVIGRNGGLPWHLPTDLRRFSALTTGNVVVMGRKTFESLPDKYRPLPNRMNIVLTRGNDQFDGATVVRTLEDAALLAAQRLRDLYIIGGASVYLAGLEIADQVLVTQVEDSVNGDTYFPRLNPESWEEVKRGELQFENDLEFRFIEYERI